MRGKTRLAGEIFEVDLISNKAAPHFDPIEIASRDEIEHLQLIRLERTLAAACHRAAPTREQFDAANAHPDDLSSLAVRDSAQFSQEPTREMQDFLDARNGITRRGCDMLVISKQPLRQVEDLLFERGLDICHETVRF